jgi:hypothetical protein
MRLSFLLVGQLNSVEDEKNEEQGDHTVYHHGVGR